MKVPNMKQFEWILIFVCIMLTGIHASYAGPFTASGQSTAKSFDSVYRKSIRPSNEKALRISEQAAEVSKETSQNTYRQSTEPTAELTSRASEKSVEFSEESIRATVDTSKETTEKTAPLNLYVMNLQQACSVTLGSSISL